VPVSTSVGAADAEPRIEQRRYGTTNSDLEQSRLWLIEEGCTHIAIESTGSYWKADIQHLETDPCRDIGETHRM